MGRVGTFVSGMITGAALLFVANHYHIVRAKDGVFVVPKVNQGLQDTFVDVRDFSLSDWQEHRMLAASILRSDRKEILEDSTLTGFRSTVSSLMNGLFGEGSGR